MGYYNGIKVPTSFIAVAEGGGGASVTVDSELSTESTNPVQNKVITAKINEVEGLVAQANTTASQASGMALSAETLAQGHEARIGNLEVANTDNEARLDTIEADYIKSTDYAGAKIGGVIKVSAAMGFGCNQDGYLQYVAASNTDIAEQKIVNKPLSPYQISKIVKSGVISNTETLTDEQKASACDWLGATKFYKHTFSIEENVNGETIEFFITSPTEKYDIESENINLEIGSSTNSLNFATMIGVMENANFNTYKVCFSIQITKTGDLWTITVVGDGIYKFWEGTRLNYSYAEV